MIKVVGFIVIGAVIVAVSPVWVAWKVAVVVRRNRRRAYVAASYTR